MTVADELARMDSQLDQLEDLTNEVFRPDLYDARDPNADVALNIQAIRTDVHQLVERGTAQQQAAAAKKYGEAFQKTCEATRKLVHACQHGTDKEKAEAGIQVVSQVSAVFPPPYGPAMGGVCSLTTMIMDLAWDCPGSSPFAAMLEAIQNMIDQAVSEIKNHMDAKFRELYQKMAQGEVAAIRATCDLILAKAHGFQQMTPQQQQDASESLASVTETAGVQIAASFGKVVDCITNLSNFQTQEYTSEKEGACVPAHLKGHHGLNCEQLRKGVDFVSAVERAINTMYTVVGWRLNQMHRVTEAHQMHISKEHFKTKARKALNDVKSDLGDWEQDRRIVSSYSMEFSRHVLLVLPQFAELSSFVWVEMHPCGGALFKTMMPEALKTQLSEDAEAIGNLRQHVQQLHDQI